MPHAPGLSIPFSSLLVLLTGVIASAPAPRLEAGDGDWPQFRGPNAIGIAPDDRPLPAEIGPEKNVRWKTTVPFGHGSPVIVGDRIYLSAAAGEKLWTIALDRRGGQELWRRQAPREKPEPNHRIGSQAQSTGAADEKGVVSFFGSSGLHAYSPSGEPLWSRRMGPFKNGFGAGSSPIIVDDLVILAQDHDTDSFLLALDRDTGERRWRTDRSEFPRGFATPVVWGEGENRQVVVAGTLRLCGYDLATGREAWTVRGIARLVNTTPVVGPDGILYFSGWSPGADPGERIDPEPFDDLLGKIDANGNGQLEYPEVPSGPLRNRYNQLDRDKDDHVTRQEYDTMKAIFLAAQNGVLAVSPGGKGDITETHVRWRNSRYQPYVPSPLRYRDHLYTVKNGGIFASLDPASGEHVRVGRLKGRGDYYSSPVAGDGKIYLLSERGDLSVVRATGEWEEIATASFAERVYATPALVGGRIYLRTESALYCFGSP